jgi:glycosyltransferase involved in cell wall biosynthesis
MGDQLVSVIVPTYNRAYCLADAVNSVLAQSHRNVEVIIIDDGSTDQTTQLVATNWGRDRRVKYFVQANQGVTAARNQGLARATGDFIAFLDSDDRWKPWKLATQIAAMDHSPEIGMVWTDMEAVDANGALIHPAYLKIMYNNYLRFTQEQLFSGTYRLAKFMPDAPDTVLGGTLHVGTIYSQMFMGSLVHTSTVMLRRDRLTAVKGFNEALKLFGEDYDFHLRTCREGPVGFIDLSSAEYRIGMPDRLTHDRNRAIGFANVLTTITQAWQRDRDRIELPPRLVRHRFAEVNAWLGEALLDSGQRGKAARKLTRSLWLQPAQSRTARLLALSLLPASVGNSMRSAFRLCKRLAAPLKLMPHKQSV